MHLRLLAATLLLAPAFVSAADWPQWRGPGRTAISKESNIRTSFSEAPKLLWTFTKAGGGFSSPAVVGNRLYGLGGDSGDFAFALNVDTGEEDWRVPLGPIARDKRGGTGPRGTPTVDGDHLYLVRGNGDIHCLSTKDGKEIWKRSFSQDFGGKMMSGWGYSESPLVDGVHVICTPGGNGAIVALDKMTGKTVWRAQDLNDDSAYASPIVADVQGVRQYIQLTRQGVAGVRASDGKLLWFFEREQRVAAIPTPIYHDNHVFATAGYNSGCSLIKLEKSGDEFKATQEYANKDMTNHHGGVVLVGEHVYGFSDSKRACICMEFKTGKVVWTSPRGGPTKGSVTVAAGHLFCYDESTGMVHVAPATPDGWKETGRFKAPKRSEIRTQDNKLWTHPVIANGKLFLRDQDLLFCFDIKK